MYEGINHNIKVQKIKKKKVVKKMNLSPGIRALEEPIITQANTFLDGGEDFEKGKFFPIDYCNHLLLRKTDDATGFGLVREHIVVFVEEDMSYVSE